MKIKQIVTSKYFGIFLVLALSVSILSNVLLTNNSVSAWCPQNAGLNDPCAEANFDSMPDKRQIDINKFKELAKSCTTGNANGPFDSIDEGTCNNAVATCIQKVIDLSRCSQPDTLANIAVYCNEGRDSGSGCSNILQYNKTAFDNAENAAKDQVAAGCTTSGSAVEQRRQQDECIAKVVDACSSQKQTKLSSSRYNELGFDNYNKCLQSASLSNAKNAQECEARGGVWNATTQGPGINRCAPSPNSPGAGELAYCTDNSKNPPETYAVQKGEKCKDGSEPSGTIPPNFNTGQYTAAGSCGGVETNLIGCQGKEGADAIGDVLRQILVIMTVGIGILAVGGIVYGAILYASAQDNAGQTKKAIEIITNTVIGLLLYIFMVTILNWLIPGGVL